MDNSYILITKPAINQFSQLLQDQEPGTGIRVFVVHPGSYNAECGVSFCPPDNIEEVDHVIDYQEFKVYVDPISWPFLNEAEIDFVTEGLESQLTIKAPNAKMKRPESDAPLIDRVDYYIEAVINPQLRNHGGRITLIEITEGNCIIQFGGGCNGCSMVDVTLKQGIEGQLLEQFPGEITGVKDVTEHQTGDHSYYK
ncbi:Fe-S biogenesis protein NfuA [Psittacicella gerlachiana]|uniref:Fe/S biogenesis protein NfuA n=1 Tax=Psittacicella gerlachiana TaxID=2028574 RepID=A0A3A1YMA2_9GAMM|nr:Fe-S biogenesis protein NfuA [Psittacicella gerlachiana]RIY38681.1 Fe-S biogenesis protein NfuA [Psittacicella gerlachiana]